MNNWYKQSQELVEEPINRNDIGTVPIEVSKSSVEPGGMLYLKMTTEGPENGIRISPGTLYDLVSRQWIKEKADNQVAQFGIKHFDDGGSVILPMDVDKWEKLKELYSQI